MSNTDRCQTCHRRDHRPGDLSAGHPYAATRAEAATDAAREAARRADADPMAILRRLGARVSPDLDDYASGRLDISQVRCVLCGTAPCGCRQCPAPHLAWQTTNSEPCGMTVDPVTGECPRGHRPEVCARPGCTHDQGSHADGEDGCGFCACPAFTPADVPASTPDVTS